MSVFPAGYGLAPPPSTAFPARGATILTSPARPPQPLLLLRGRKAALEVTRDAEPAPLSRHNLALGTLPVLSPRTP